jgi:hypothetical protein
VRQVGSKFLKGERWSTTPELQQSSAVRPTTERAKFSDRATSTGHCDRGASHDGVENLPAVIAEVANADVGHGPRVSCEIVWPLTLGHLSSVTSVGVAETVGCRLG